MFWLVKKKIENLNVQIKKKKIIRVFLQKEMNLQITSLGGAITNIPADGNETVFDLKKKIAKEKNVDVSQIKLIFNKKMLQNDPQLANLGITDMSRIILMVCKNPNPVKIQKQEKAESPIKTIITPKKAPSVHNSPIAKTIHPETAPLPSLESKYNDPPDFDEKAKALEAMGFDLGDCYQALRAALYSIEMASNFLVQGYIPDAPQMPLSATDAATIRMHNSNGSDDEFLSDDDDGEEEKGEPIVSPDIVRDLYDNPHKINAFLNKLIEINPDDSFLIKNNPALFLAQIGIDPSRFDLSSFQNQTVYSELMGKFTKDEQNTIKRISEKGFDTMMVIQFFEACDKNEELTLQCLGGN